MSGQVRLPLLLCLAGAIGAAAGCSRDRSVTGIEAASPAAPATPLEPPTQAFWPNVVNRAGLSSYTDLATPAPDRQPMQLAWLGPGRAVLMRAGGARPPEIGLTALGEGGWSSLANAGLSGVNVHALMDGALLDGGVPMIAVLADSTDWAQVLGLSPGDSLNDVISDQDFQRLLNQTRRLYTSLMAGGRWTAPLPVPGSMGALHAILRPGPAGTALLVFVRDPDGDPGTTGDGELYAARFDGARWGEPVRLSPAPGLDFAPAAVASASAHHLAWVRDADGDMETTGDRTVWTAALTLSGEVARAAAPLAGPYERPWPVLGTLDGSPVLLFSGDGSGQGARPLLESRFSVDWSQPRDVGLKAGAVVHGQLFPFEDETLLVYEDGNDLFSATTRGGAWHSAGFLRKFDAHGFRLSEASAVRDGEGLRLGVIGRAGGAGGDGALAAHLPIGPDLALAGVLPDRPQLAVGEPLALQVVVENRGQLHSRAFTVSLAGGGAGATELDGLWPGERRQYELPLTLASASQPVEVVIVGTRADLDPSNERQSLVLRALPDFAVAHVRREGNAMVAKVVDVKGVATTPVNVDFVLVKGGTRTILHQATFDPSAALPVRFEWSGWPPEAEPYSISVRVNDRTPVLEDDETNNLGEYLHRPSPDFVVQRVEVRPGSIRAVVANVGPIPAPRVELLLTDDPELAVSPEPLEGVPPLFRGEVDVSSGQGTVEVPPGPPATEARYFLYAVVNPYGTVPEVNRDNNMLRVSRRPGAEPEPPLAPELYALESMRLRHGARLTGTAVVATDGPAADDLVLGPEAQVNGAVVGNHVRLLPGTAVSGTITNNRLEVGPRSTHGGSVTPLPLPHAFPVPPVSTTPGTDDVVVASVTTLGPGSYRDVRVGPGATLKLSGGSLSLRSLSLESKARVECLQPCEVRVAQSLTASANAYLGPALGLPLAPRDVQVRVAGASAQLGKGMVIRAEIAAPAAALALGQGSRLEGRAIGRSIDVGQGAVVESQAPASPRVSAAPAPLQVTVQSESRSGRAHRGGR